MLVGPTKWLKHIIQIKHNRAKNPNCPEANQLAIYKQRRGFELGGTVKKSSRQSVGAFEMDHGWEDNRRALSTIYLNMFNSRFEH